MSLKIHYLKDKAVGKIRYEDTGHEEEVEDGHPIQEACEELGVSFACKAGVCGSCRIEVKEGMFNLSPYSREQDGFLGWPGRGAPCLSVSIEVGGGGDHILSHTCAQWK